MLRSAPSIPMPARAAEARTLWALNGLPDTTARYLERWLDALAALPLDEWTRIGQQCVQRDHAMLAMTRACSRVETAIADHDLAVTAWLVRDAVETATYHVRRHAACQPRRVRAQLTVARMAAEWAALALATQPWLTAGDLNDLCAPFEYLASLRALATA
jgi:hypothetical protein